MKPLLSWVRKFSKPTALELLIAVLLCTACSLLCLRNILETRDFYRAVQALRFPSLLVLFKAQFLAGHWFPRWMPQLVGGYGYPSFVFYPAGFWFFALPFSLFLNVTTACKVSVLLLVILTGVGSFRLARLFASPAAAYMATGLFYLAPALYTEYYFYAVFSEGAALACCPWVFFYAVLFFRKACAGESLRSTAIKLALTSALLAYCHPFITIWAALAIGIFMITVATGLPEYKAWPFMQALALVALLAAAVSAAYWYSALALHHDIPVEQAFFRHRTTYRLTELFELKSRWLGAILPGAALIGLVFNMSKKEAQATLLCSAILIFFMLDVSLPVRQNMLLFSYLQGSQRIMRVLMPLETIGLAYFFQVLSETIGTKTAIAAGGLMAVALAVFGYHFHRVPQQVKFSDYWHQAYFSFSDQQHYGEFMPLHANKNGLQKRHRLVEADGQVSERYNHADSDFSYDMVTEHPEDVTINQFDFPGWVVELNGSALPHCPEAGKSDTPSYCYDEHGRLDVWLPTAGTQELRAYYDGPPGWLARNLIATAVAIASLLALGWLDKKYFRPASGSPAMSGTQ